MGSGFLAMSLLKANNVSFRYNFNTILARALPLESMRAKLSSCHVVDRRSTAKPGGG